MNMIMKICIFILLLGACTAYSVKRVRRHDLFLNEYFDATTDDVTNSDDDFSEDDVSYGLDDEPLRLKECQKFHPIRFINNGKNAGPKEFPHMALIGFGEQDDIQWNCGGSLISPEFILTAAHCLYNRNLGNVKYIKLGELDVNSTLDDVSAQNFKVKKVYQHDKYLRPSKYNDIALIQLDRPVTITDSVKPACLPLKDNIDDIELTIAGWGETTKRGRKANVLQKAQVKYVSKDICSIIYQPSDLVLKDGVVDTQICAGGKSDTCEGDSGGPLQFINEKYGFPEIVGITSVGKPCGQLPGIYTKVSQYIPWIEKIIWPEM